MFWKKNRLKKAYNEGMIAIQLSLYEIFVSILKDDLGNQFSDSKIKEAAGITVNKLGLKPDDRPDPGEVNDQLACSLYTIKNLTLIKEARAMILLFDYYFSDKAYKDRYEKAKDVCGESFETMTSLIDIEKTSVKTIRSISAAMSNKLNETALIDIRKQL